MIELLDNHEIHKCTLIEWSEWICREKKARKNLIKEPLYYQKPKIIGNWKKTNLIFRWSLLGPIFSDYKWDLLSWVSLCLRKQSNLTWPNLILNLTYSQYTKGTYFLENILWTWKTLSYLILSRWMGFTILRPIIWFKKGFTLSHLTLFSVYKWVLLSWEQLLGL